MRWRHAIGRFVLAICVSGIGVHVSAAVAADATETTLRSLVRDATTYLGLVENLHRPNPAPQGSRFVVPYGRLIQNAGRRHHIPEPLIAAVIQCESDRHPDAHSRAGARGLMQVMPATAVGEFLVDPQMLWDPAINIEVGTAYLRRLAHRYRGRTDAVIAAYNAGPTRIESGKQLPGETVRYLRCVRGWHVRYAVLLAVEPRR